MCSITENWYRALLIGRTKVFRPSVLVRSPLLRWSPLWRYSPLLWFGVMSNMFIVTSFDPVVLFDLRFNSLSFFWLSIGATIDPVRSPPAMSCANFESMTPSDFAFWDLIIEAMWNTLAAIRSGTRPLLAILSVELLESVVVISDDYTPVILDAETISAELNVMSWKSIVS